MDYANDNKPAEVARYRGSFSLLALALLVSLALWLVVGLSVWRAFSGWRYES
jgi:hypothetical protein